MKIFFLIILIMAQLQAKNITDMLGRTTTIPDTPKKVYAPSPYGSYALYAMDPNLLVGWIFNIDPKFYPYLHKRMETLPVIGRVFGAGQAANLEVLLATHPDLILMWSHVNEFTQKEEQRLKVLNTPYVYALDENLLDYVQVFKFLGEALSLEERGNALSAYTQKTFDDVKNVVKNVPQEKRPRVYYAEGLDGLSTECNDSIHVEILQIAGDVNIHKCHTSSHKGFEKLSMERVLQYDPDVIFVQDELFFQKIYNSKLWKDIEAVKNKKVFLIPKAPFNWFDRPPSFMRILGLKWVMHNLYPKEYPIDMAQETKDFYKLFLNVELTQKQLNTLLNIGADQ
jgi:iron complex transport system substrate-binding protein